MGKHTCIFYETAGGKSPAEGFIESLDENTQDKFIFHSDIVDKHNISILPLGGQPSVLNTECFVFKTYISFSFHLPCWNQAVIMVP